MLEELTKVFFFVMMPPPPRSTLFPYTTLFRSGRIFQHQLAPVLNRDQFLEVAFTNQHATRENSDTVADLLHLGEQMRRQEDGDAALFKIDNQIANVA